MGFALEAVEIFWWVFGNYFWIDFLDTIDS